MTARHQRPPSSDQARLRLLVLTLGLALVLGFFIFGSGGTGGPIETSVPLAGETTTTSAAGATTTSPPGSETTLPGVSTTTLPPLQEVVLDLVFEGFRQPTFLTAPVGDDRLFVVQRVGVIRILDANREMLDPAFLDITDRVLAGGIEQGLLGLAFHPEYATNGRFFVYYTDRGGRRQLSEFTVSSDPNHADHDSERVLIEREQPPDATDIRHYGGNVDFGPDGYLWASLGDGADSRAQGQNPFTMFGAVVRGDVDSGGRGPGARSRPRGPSFPRRRAEPRVVRHGGDTVLPQVGL